MKIVLAQTAGFCMGVRRAVDMALSLVRKAQKDGPVYTFGPLIHNPQVLDRLASQGLKVLSSVPDRAEGTVLIRAHGVAPRVREGLAAAGLSVMDATCPRVAAVQEVLSRLKAEGRPAVIFGDPDHPEIQGLVGHAPEQAMVIRTPDEARKIPPQKGMGIVSQTTQDKAAYAAVCRVLTSRSPGAEVFFTICGATEKRQNEARDLARTVDAIVVVGGRDSANTRRLHGVASQTGALCFHVEDPRELDLPLLASLDRVGITAGASTPRWVIREVCRELEHAAAARKAAPGPRPLKALG